MSGIFVNRVTTKSGGRIRVMLRDCNETALVSADVSKIRYTIYEVANFAVYTPVPGHTDVTVVPEETIFDTPQTDTETGRTFNFEHTISMQANFPFPNRRSQYQVEYSFFDTGGEAHVHKIFCTTDEEGSDFI